MITHFPAAGESEREQEGAASTLSAMCKLARNLFSPTISPRTAVARRGVSAMKQVGLLTKKTMRDKDVADRIIIERALEVIKAHTGVDDG